MRVHQAMADTASQPGPLKRSEPAAGDVREGDIAELQGVIHTYAADLGNQPIHALGPIDLKIQKGEFFSVVGPSGCGKSTMLDVLAGLTTPTEGTVLFEGRPLGGQVPLGIGVVFQEDSTLPWLSVWDNIAFGLRRNHVAPKDIKDRVDRVIGMTGLSQFTDSYPSQLSGGMRQRVCIARTLVMDPHLILLDEPFGALDQQTRVLMGDDLLRLWRRTDATVVLITHAIDEATMLSDRVGVMSARPGNFIEILSTGWSRDRDSTVISDPSFGAATAHIWEKLRAESMRALGRPEVERDA